ncbi:MAG TPA: hypothetical protein VFY68_04490 [Nitrososphaeraceae archaeon]|nr:hypothetical protein [Nitrososphaeraceae archaeon]
MLRLLFAVGLLVLLPGVIDNAAILASAQDSKTIQISIVLDATRLTNTAYQPNPINIKESWRYYRVGLMMILPHIQ